MKSPIQFDNRGNAMWEHQNGDVYVATGVDTKGRRFKAIRSHWHHINGINLWRGTKWLERDGRRYVIQRVYN